MKSTAARKQDPQRHSVRADLPQAPLGAVTASRPKPPFHKLLFHNSKGIFTGFVELILKGLKKQRLFLVFLK